MYKKMLQKLTEKLRVKFLDTTRHYSMEKIARLDDAFFKCQFDENRHQFFPHFFAQNSQFNRKTFFDANKIEYNHSLGRKKLL